MARKIDTSGGRFIATRMKYSKNMQEIFTLDDPLLAKFVSWNADGRIGAEFRLTSAVSRLKPTLHRCSWILTGDNSQFRVIITTIM